MIKTAWGYTLTDANTLTPILSQSQFNEITANKYTSDMRASENIKAASAAVRNYCGWHVYPLEECELTTTAIDQRITRSGSDLLIQLPARYVESISSVNVGGVEREFTYETSGLLRVYDTCACDRRTQIVVEYEAGFPDALMDGVKELIAHRVTHALASSAGVQSETAGGVSITYSANWINSARSTALADDNKEVLEPFRLEGVF